MKIQYIYPPLFKPFFPMATRIITENLVRNKRLETTFSDMPVKAFSSNIDQELYDGILTKAAHKFSPNVMRFLRQKYMVNNIFYVFMAQGYFDEFILIDTDDEYYVFTCLNFCDLLIVKHLLEQKRRVVLGGPLINIGLSSTFIRNFLRTMGVSPLLLSKNLIILSGNIDLTTDLHRMIRDWKDAAITENDYGTVFDCRHDFLKDFYPDTASIPVHMGFSNHCWYGKCKFCTYRELPRMNFLADRESTQISDSIHDLMKRFGSDHIRFIDSYFRSGSRRVTEILEQIKDYHTTVYTGISMLKDRKYITFLNRYINCLLIGLETTSDFSLKQVDKGYTLQDIEMAVETMIKYMDRSIFLEISLILDLPCQDAEDVKANYARIAEIKERLTSEGFRVAFHMNILSTFPNLELLYTGDKLLEASRDPSLMRRSTGKNYIINILRECGMDKPLQLPRQAILRDEQNEHNLAYGYISSDIPIIRRDIHGAILPSDLELMDEEVMKSILTRKSGRG